ncbi:hypothetical protein KKB54_03970 [bacterium]|nr:hypothetical protein [bacterium]MBU0899956.1 hypothetical protein [bacterium]MBU1153586.1 hypothetical protein [bacterium]MBU2600224.1 hypothetical protein [bacterium]
MKVFKIKELFFKNIGLKCFSIIVGILLWIYVSTEEGVVRNFKIPINYVGISNNLSISHTSEDKILITVQGERENILSCQASDFRISLSLSKKTSGSYTYRLFPYEIVRPPDIFIKKIYPEYIKVTLKEKVIKEREEGNKS